MEANGHLQVRDDESQGPKGEQIQGRAVQNPEVLAGLDEGQDGGREANSQGPPLGFCWRRGKGYRHPSCVGC